MNFEITEQQQAFAEAAKAFADDQMRPHAAKWDAEAIFPKEVFKRAGEFGFMGLYTPEAVGGLGVSRLDTSFVVEELARGCTTTAAFITIHNMATCMIGKYGQSELQHAILPALIEGQKLASYCLTEPGSGSDAASLRTTAKKDGDHYVINGSKAFISGAGETDYLVVMARTGGPGPKGVSAIVVDAQADGVAYGKKEEKMGWNAQPTATISFTDVRVPVGNLLANEGDGFKLAMEGLDGGRLNIATCSIGTAQEALSQALNYVQEREQFGKAIAGFQHTQFKLADMATELVAARNMVRMAAYYLDTGHNEASAYCAMAKRFATDVGFKVCNDALQLHGGYGYIKEYPLERMVRDSRVHQILEGTNEIMRVIIGKKLMIEGMAEVLK